MAVVEVRKRQTLVGVFAIKDVTSHSEPCCAAPHGSCSVLRQYILDFINRHIYDIPIQISQRRGEQFLPRD